MVNYRAIHMLTYFRETFGFRAGDFPVAERLGDANLSLPLYPNMPSEHADIVAEALAQILESRA
jgi:UDP-4-amino-4-deoxy-L-arabinose-oxoglutarate aminotransferase